MPTQAQMLRVLARVARAITITFASVIVVVALAIAFLAKTNAGHTIVLDRLVPFLNDNIFAVPIHADAIDGNLLRGARIRGVTFREQSDAQPLIAAELLIAEWDLAAILFDSHIRIPFIRLEGLRVRGRLDESGQLDLAGLLLPSDTPDAGPAPHVSIERIEISDGAFELRDSRNGDARVVNARNLSASASFELLPEILSAKISEFAGVTGTPVRPDAEIPFAFRDVTLGSESTALALSLGTLSLGRSSLNGFVAKMLYPTGNFSEFTSVTLESPNLVVGPSELEKFLPSAKLLQPVEIGLSVSGSASGVSATIPVRSAAGSLSIDLAFAPGEPASSYSARLSLPGFAPHRWLDLNGAEALLNGEISLTVLASNPADAVIDLAADLSDSSVLGYPVEEARAALHFENDKLEIRDFVIAAFSSSLEISGEYQLDGDLDLAVDLDARDLAAFAPLAAAQLAPAPAQEPASDGEHSESTSSPQADTANPLNLDGSVAAQLRASGNVPDFVIEERRGPDSVFEWAAFLGALSLSGSVQARELALADNSIRELDLNVETQVTLIGPGARASLRVDDLRVNSTEVDALALNLSTSGPTFAGDIDTTLATPALELDTKFSGMYLNQIVTLKFAELGMELSGHVVDLTRSGTLKLELDELWTPVAIEISKIEAEIDDSPVTLYGKWANSGSVEGALVCPTFDLDLIDRFVLGNADILSGRVSVDARISGTLAEPEGALQMTADNVVWDGLPAISGELRTDVRNRRTSLQCFLESANRPVLNLSTGARWLPIAINLQTGSVDFDKSLEFDVTAEIVDFDLKLVAPFISNESLDLKSARLNAVFVSTGSIAEPFVDFLATIDQVSATAAVAEAVIELDTLGVQAEAHYGRLSAGEVPRLDADLIVDWKGRSLASAALVADYDLLSSMNSGVWLAEGLDGTLNLQVPELDVTTLPPELLEIAGLRGGSVELNAAVVGSAQVPTLDITFAASSVLLREFPAFDLRAELNAAQSTQLRLGVQSSSGKEVGWPDADGLWFSDASDTDSSLRAALDVTVSSDLNSLATNGIRLTDVVSARAIVPSVTLETIREWVPSIPETPGSVSGYLDFTGVLANPTLRSRVALRDVTMLDGTVGFFGAELAVQNYRISGEVFSCSEDEVTMRTTLDGQIPLVRQGPGILSIGPAEFSKWPVSAHVLVQEQSLGSIVPFVVAQNYVSDARGKLNADLVVSGIENPTFFGSLEIVDGTLGLVSLGQTYNSINVAALRPQGSEVLTLSRLELGSAGGDATGGGEITFSGLRPRDIAISLKLDEFLASSASGAGAYLSGETTASVTFSEESIAVDLTAADLILTLPEEAAIEAGDTSLPDSIVFVGEDVDVSQIGERAPVRVVNPDEPIESETPIRFSIRTTNDGEFRHSLANIKFAADLRGLLDSGGLEISGQVDISSGTVRAAGKVFDVTRGRIRFPENDRSMNPQLDVLAVHHLAADTARELEEKIGPPGPDGALVQVAINGSLTALDRDPASVMSLTSDPPLSSEQIFQVLSSGHLSDGEDSTEQGVGAVSALLLGVLGDRIGDTVKIDTLRIEGDTSQQRIEGGKYLAENLYVSGTYIRSPEDTGDNNVEFALQWILRKLRAGTLQIELRGGDKGYGGLELLYTIVPSLRRGAQR